MKKCCKPLILITAVIMMFGLFGCGKDARFDMETYKNAEKNTMLLDYYERTVGTPEEQPYYELVLYTYSDTQALLEEYTDGGTDEEILTKMSEVVDDQNVMSPANRKKLLEYFGGLIGRDGEIVVEVESQFWHCFKQ